MFRDSEPSSVDKQDMRVWSPYKVGSCFVDFTCPKYEFALRVLHCVTRIHHFWVTSRQFITSINRTNRVHLLYSLADACTRKPKNELTCKNGLYTLLINLLPRCVLHKPRVLVNAMKHSCTTDTYRMRQVGKVRLPSNWFKPTPTGLSLVSMSRYLCTAFSTLHWFETLVFEDAKTWWHAGDGGAAISSFCSCYFSQSNTVAYR